MKKLIVTGSLAALAALFFVGGTNASSSLFSDGFESDDFSNWTSSEVPWTVNGTSSISAHMGIKRATAEGLTAEGSEIGSITKMLSTAGFENISLSYWYRIKENMETGDHVWVQWSTDGNTWNQIADHTGTATTSFQFASLALPSDANNLVDFQFRFYASLGNSGDDFWLDDVELTGDAIATPTPTSTPTPTPTLEPTPTPTLEPIPTVTPTPEPSIEPTPTPSPTPEITPTPEPTPTPTPEPTPTPTPTPEPTLEPTPEPTAHLDPDPILDESNPANENALTHILRNIARWIEKHV
ncbi:MAG: hypothetical protein AAB420_00400 [Patescibacteria group bacterium]